MEDSALNDLKCAINEIKVMNDQINEFNKAIEELSLNLKEIVKLDEQQEIAIAANDVNEALVEMNKRYKEFLDTDFIKNELQNQIIDIQKSISKLDKKIQKDKKEFHTIIPKELEKFKVDLIEEMKKQQEELINKSNSNVEKNKLTNCSKSGNAFINGDFIYYISEINDGIIHRYNCNNGKEDVCDILNDEMKLIKFSKILCVEIEGDCCLIGIDKNSKRLYVVDLEFKIGTIAAYFCIDFVIYLDRLYALSHNKLIVIDINTNTILTTYRLFEDNEIDNNKGSIEIIGDILFININEQNIIYNVRKEEFIELL